MWKIRISGFSQMGRPLVNLRDQGGQVWVPLVILMGVLICLGLGTLILRVKYRASVQTQRRIDQCVQEKTERLTTLQNRIEKSNQRIQFERYSAMALIAATPVLGPGALEALKVIRHVIQAEARFQDALLVRWKWEQAQWIAKRGCDSRDDPSPFNLLPSPAWRRDPPDLIGEKAMQWPDPENRSLSIRLTHGPRRSSSEVYSDDQNKWKARWQPYFGAITH